ncbi:hypothetical protein OG946_24490 [Streptomyces sp. NBC_01808]|nr:hypothetical protein [Streptomyces sp. NBC_01808]WSA40244.1 hypothetical protein OG946_24490 [Streptomyces sp. NBC_01808]
MSLQQLQQMWDQVEKASRRDPPGDVSTSTLAPSHAVAAGGRLVVVPA